MYASIRRIDCVSSVDFDFITTKEFSVTIHIEFMYAPYHFRLFNPLNVLAFRMVYRSARATYVLTQQVNVRELWPSN